MPCAQYNHLKNEFPKTLLNLEQWFVPTLAHSVTNQAGHNPAGYCLYQLRRAHRHALVVHGEVRGCLAICDINFAAEVRWHKELKTQFRNLWPAFGACWYNLVHERGERWRELSLTTQEERLGSPLRVCNSAVSIGEMIDEIARKTRPGMAG